MKSNHRQPERARPEMGFPVPQWDAFGTLRQSGPARSFFWVKLYRKLLDSSLWSLSPDALRLAIYILLQARNSDTSTPFGTIGRGQLLTSLNHLSDGCSWFENRMIRRWSRQTTKRLLDKLVADGFCSYKSDTCGTLITVTNYETYQGTRSNNPDSCGTPVEHAVCIESKKERVLKRKGHTSYVPKESESESERQAGLPGLPGIPQPTKKAKSIKAEDIERIYKAYPRKVAPASAKAAIRRALSEISPEDLLAKVEQFAVAVDGAEKRYIPHPERWFKRHRWEDDPDEWELIGRGTRASEWQTI